MIFHVLYPEWYSEVWCTCFPGCARGLFGAQCDRECHCAGGKCSENGQCRAGCADGWTGDDCQTGNHRCYTCFTTLNSHSKTPPPPCYVHIWMDTKFRGGTSECTLTFKWCFNFRLYSGYNCYGLPQMSRNAAKTTVTLNLLKPEGCCVVLCCVRIRVCEIVKPFESLHVFLKPIY